MIDEWDVGSFMIKSEQLNYETVPGIPGTVHLECRPGIPELYVRLIREEYTELTDAIDLNHSDEKILNEAMDLIWVTIGYLLARGHSIDGAWKALTTANHAKLQVDPATGKLLRRADGKIQKPEGWKPADFSPFVGVVKQEGKVTDER